MRKVKALIVNKKDLKEEFRFHTFKNINSIGLFNDSVIKESALVDVVAYKNTDGGEKIIICRG